jgi:hypothetical protein
MPATICVGFAASDTVGDWDGQEQLAADNYNRILKALYAAIPSDTPDTIQHEIFKKAWDDWGSDSGLLTITDYEITEYVSEQISPE